MKIIKNWRQAWKMNSVQIFALIAALPAVWLSIPEDIKAMIPVEWQPWIISAVAIGGMAARLRDQSLPK